MSLSSLHGEFPSSEVAPGGCKLLRIGDHRLAVFRLDDGQLFAVDDACPHEGYPLSRGTVKDCVVTCPWHNFKFRLDDGFCLKGDEAVATHRVHERDGTISVEVIEPPREELIARFTASLHEGLYELRIGQIARDAVRLLRLGVEPTQLAALCAVHDARHAEYGTSHATAVATDVCRYFERHQGTAAALPLMQAFELCAQTHVRRPIRPLAPSCDPGEDPVLAGTQLLELLEEERLSEAESLLRGALALGWQREVFEPWFLRACSSHWIGFGHGLIYVTKTFDLLGVAGWQHAAQLLPALLTSLGSMTREDQIPEWLWFHRRMDEVRPRFQEFSAMPRQEKTEAPSGLLALLLDGHREAAFESITEQLDAGVPVARIVDVLVVAASERILRFDERIDADPTIQNGWLAVTHCLTYAHAVRCALERLPEAEMLTLLYFGARIINATKSLDRPEAERFSLDGGEEDHASLEDCVQATSAGRPQAALDALSSWLTAGAKACTLRSWAEDLALSDEITRPLVVGHLIKTTCAAFDEHLILEAAGSAQALRPIQALIRLADSPIRERRIARVTHEALRFVIDGKVPRSLI